jgi:hypothetical protein
MARDTSAIPGRLIDRPRAASAASPGGESVGRGPSLDSSACRYPWVWTLLPGLLLLFSGCSLFVMAGKMILGDPTVKCQFRQQTKTDLARLDRSVLILCTASDSVRTQFPSVEFDVLEGVTHRLKVHGIKRVVSPDAVAGWIDDHGGEIDDVKGLAEHFHADYVIHIELTRFTTREEKSPNLLRGQSEGRVHAYQLQKDEKPEKSGKRLLEIMASDFSSTYPEGNPVSIDKKSADAFQLEYIERVTLQLAQIFYDHTRTEEMP